MLDTLGVVARTIGEATFLPFSEECLHFTLNLVKSKDDPDLRKCGYGVFASVSSVLKDGMSPALPAIIPLLITAVENNEGEFIHQFASIAAIDQEKNKNHFGAGVELVKEEDDEFPNDMDDDEDVSPMDNDDDDEDDNAGYTVENAYLEEKEEACLALREIAANSRYYLTQAES